MKKIFIYFFSFLLIVAVLVFGIYFSPIGNDLLEKYVLSHICMNKKFKVSYFNHSLNSFSIELKYKNNNIQVFGTLFPFTSTYNLQFKNIQQLNKDIKGTLNSSGTIEEKDSHKIIKGNLLVAKGYGKIYLSCNDDKPSEALVKLADINTEEFLQMFKTLKLPFKIGIKGQNDLLLNLKNDIYLINSHFKGELKINNLKYLSDIFLSLKIFDKNKFDYSLFVKSNKLYGKIKGKYRFFYKLKGIFEKFDTNIFYKNLLYPINKIIPLKFTYDTQTNVFNFSSKGFSGYFDNKLNIQIDMPLEKFFYFLSLPEVLKGKISGNISVGKNGVFNLLVTDANFNKKYITKIETKLKTDLNRKKSVFFLNGTFDSKKVIFNFISKDMNYYLSVKKGIYYYTGKFDFKLEFKSSKKYTLFDINNKGVYVIKSYYLNKASQTIVY